MFIPTLLKGFAKERDRLILLELHFLYTPVNCKNLVLSGGSAQHKSSDNDLNGLKLVFDLL